MEPSTDQNNHVQIKEHKIVTEFTLKKSHIITVSERK